MIIDPGTGAYYSNSDLRGWLSSGAAHNGPHTSAARSPRRFGPFLWSEHHPKPSMVCTGKGTIIAEHNNATARRSIDVSDGNRAVVTDAMRSNHPQSFTVLWQFAPGAVCQQIEPHTFRVTRQQATLDIAVGANWETVNLVTTHSPLNANASEGTVSPHFRFVTWAPYLKLTASPADQRHPFTTTFSVVGESS